MMIRNVLLLTLLFSHYAYAVSTQECIQLHGQLGNYGISEKDISPKCYSLFKSETTAKAIHQDVASNREVVVFKNTIYLKDLNSGKIYINSGDQTRARDLVAVFYDSENQEIYAFDREDFSVKVYNANIMGNVAPYRIIKTESLSGVIDIVVQGEKVYVLNSSMNKVFAFSREANSLQLEGKRKLELLEEYEMIPNEAYALEINGDKIEVKDVENNFLLVLPRN